MSLADRNVGRGLVIVALMVALMIAGATAFAAKAPRRERQPNQISEPGPVVPRVELLGISEIPGTEEFAKTRIGGLSGVVYDESQKMWWAVSDDRGRVNEPRVYGLEMTLPAKGGAPSWKVVKVVTLKDAKVDPKKRKSVWDLEGIALLPWGNWLVVSEGDMNQKPRVNSRVMEFKLNGDFVRDYEIPDDYVAPSTGRQARGPRNNFSFEGLAAHPDGTHWVVASELGLIQDKGETTRLLEFAQTEAWVLKAAREWFYPLAATKSETSKSTNTNTLVTGVSEVLSAREDDWWVLERGAGIGLKGLSFDVSIFAVNLGTNQEPAKTLIANLSAMDAKLARNFEAMAWGPKLQDGRDLLVLISDNNLEKNEPSVIASFAVTWPQPASGAE